MRKLLCVLVLLCASAQGAQVPALVGPVNDYAHVLSADQINQLNSMLLAEEKRTSNQVMVLTITSLEGDSVEDYAQRVFQTWHPGQKKEVNKAGNNGVLFVIAVNDHKMRIHVGYGLEANLTDGMCGEILRNDVTPPFKDEKYYDGISAGTTKILQGISGTYVASATPSTGTVNAGQVIGIILLVVLAIFCSALGSEELLLPAGFAGGIGTFLICFLLLAFGFLAAFLLGIVGFLLGMLACTIGPDVIGSIGDGSFSSGSFGSSSSSDSGSSYSGGGGDSGGGGASGSW